MLTINVLCNRNAAMVTWMINALLIDECFIRFPMKTAINLNKRSPTLCDTNLENIVKLLC